jgi:hypothetical protein
MGSSTPSTNTSKTLLTSPKHVQPDYKELTLVPISLPHSGMGIGWFPRHVHPWLVPVRYRRTADVARWVEEELWRILRSDVYHWEWASMLGDGGLSLYGQ